MLSDKPLRAADSRTARQTISQAARTGRKQAAIQYAGLPDRQQAAWQHARQQAKLQAGITGSRTASRQ